MTKFLALTVLLSALVIAGFAKVTVSAPGEFASVGVSHITVTAPTNGAILPSPVKFVAAASSSSGITGMVIYVDSKNVYSTKSASLTASIAMSNGQHAIVVKAWNSRGRTYSDSMTINVTAATPPAPVPVKIVTTSLAGGTAGTGYSATLTASGGTSPYQWSLSSGSLPTGLSLSTAGVVSGTPTASGSFSFTVKATDSAATPQSVSGAESITVAAAVSPLSITSTSLPSGTTGTSYSATLTATGGTSPYKWNVASGSLPAGLALSTAGVVSGTPTASGSFSFTVKATDSAATPQSVSGAESITVASAVLPLSITSTSLPSGTTGTSYSATLTATGGTSPYKWNVASGSLPAGLSLSTAGIISGTPTASGSSSFTVKATDSAATPQSVSASENITIGAAAIIPIKLMTSSLPGGTVSSAYSATLSASGGTSPYIWSVVSGQLPAGLNLSGAGVISGMPTASGTSTFSLQVKDSAASPQAATQSESIAVVAAASSSCSGTCYYVSPTGNDSNSGTSTSSPWQTIAKVQNFQASLKPGSSVLFERGGVWSEELDITDMNGSSGSPITIGNYGSGALPVIDGGQTASSNGRNYCIDATSGTFKWITVDGIECRNAYMQGITFKAYGSPGTNGVGIVVQNSYIHHTGAKACTTCGSTPASDPGGYLNQLDAQQTTGVQFLNNTIDHCGGHNCVQIHYDIGNAVVSGNVVGTNAPWCNHNCIDVKGGNTTVSNNTVNCSGCGSTVSAFYTEYNGFSGVAGGSTTTTEHISYIGNISILSPEGFHSDSGGSCTTSSCSLQATYFNNTAYAGSNSSFQQFIHSTCTSGTSINIQKNIVDGGQSGWDSACGSKITWNYNDDGGVYPTSLGGSAGANDLKNVNPQYVGASTGNFTPQNTTITTYGAGDSVTPYAYVGAK